MGVAFDSKLLNPDEEVLLDTRPHWSFIAPQLLLLVLIIAVVSALYTFDVLKILLPAGLVVIGIAALNLIYRCWQWAGINFVVTTDRLIFRTGIFSKYGIELPIERINTVLFRQSFLERIIGSGDLSIESAGETGRQDFDNVDRPRIVQQEIYRAVELNEERRMAQQAHASAQAHQRLIDQHGQESRSPSIPEQIKALDDLRIQGVITDAEFQTKKTELLKRM